MQKLRPGEAQWNGWCSAKGRLLATFLLVRRDADYLMMLPAELAPGIAKRLKMYVLRSKVAIEDVSAGFVRVGIAGAGAAQAAAALPQALQVPLTDGRVVVIAPAASADSLWAALEGKATRAGADAWELASIRAGIPTVLAKTQEEFVPQMANFELVGGVSFKKGCYPGQEIVARTQYRGILKKRMVRARVPGEAPQPGDPLRTTAFGEQAAGTIVNAAPAPEGGCEVLAVAQLEGIAARDLRLADGRPLEILELPYALPEPA